MYFMNEWEIRDRRDRHRADPVLGPATQFLFEFMHEVNLHSDGWPYWSAPVHAAGRLMTLVQRNTATEAEVRKALIPIKRFMTQRGRAAGMNLPPYGGGQNGR